MTSEVIGAFSILFVMLGMLGLAAWAIKRLGLLPGQPKMRGRNKEITVIDNQILDARNRLVIVNWRGRDYFLGTGQNSISVIDRAEEGKLPSAFQKALAEENRREKN